MTTVTAEELAEVFVEVADTLVDEFDLIEFLHNVSTRISECLGASAAGLLLADKHGQLQLMAASDERTQMLELFQTQSHEGPCHDCFQQGRAVINADLAQAAAQWPRFAPRAVAAGFRSVHAIPLRLRKRTVGALNLFGDDTGQLGPNDVRVAQALADVATIGLLQEQTIRRGEQLSAQLQTALDSRIIIEQAKGALAQIHGLNTDEAFTRLRNYSRSHNRRLSEVAYAAIHDPASVSELTTP